MNINLIILNNNLTIDNSEDWENKKFKIIKNLRYYYINRSEFKIKYIHDKIKYIHDKIKYIHDKIK
jgi:hypothetical protein